MRKLFINLNGTYPFNGIIEMDESNFIHLDLTPSENKLITNFNFFLDKNGNDISENQLIKGKTQIPEKVKKTIDDIFLIIGD